MQVFVKTLDGTTYIIDVDPNDGIFYFKDKVFDKSGVYPDIQRLIFAGRVLLEDRSLSEYNISKESTIHMVLRLPGGCKLE